MARLSECPECHQSFEGASEQEVLVHRNHWPDTIQDRIDTKEAQRRAAAIVEEYEVRHEATRREEAHRIVAEDKTS